MPAPTRPREAATLERDQEKRGPAKAGPDPVFRPIARPTKQLKRDQEKWKPVFL
jgi:hypothetical protein